MGLREILIPQDKVFFQLLEKESKNVLVGAKALQNVMSHYEELAKMRSYIKDVEHGGDEIVHQIYDRLSKSFVTPIDREDIGKLASLYDDVLDYIYAVANRLYLYEIDSPTEPMRKFVNLVVNCVEEIDFAFASIHKIRAPDIETRCNEVDRLENEADALLNESVAGLFKSHDPLVIIKLKEIYELLELVTDACEDVVEEIRRIVLEYS